MKIVKTVLNLILLICFAVTDIVYTIPSGYPVLNRSALRPISTKNSTLASDIKPKATPAERETDYWYSRAIAMQELEEAEKSYLQNDLESVAIATEILRRYRYSEDIDVQRKAIEILSKRGNVYVVRYMGKPKHTFDKTAYTEKTIPAKDTFEDMLREGKIKPVVIINIKKLYPRIELAYAEELERISELYNGNVTFVLKVESRRRFPADWPGVLQALNDTKAIMGEEAFNAAFTIQIADGGFKTRLGPISLRYLTEGLTPYYRGTLYVHEVLLRSGRQLMALARRKKGKFEVKDHIICGSDTLGSPRSLHFERNRDIQIAMIRRRKNEFTEKATRSVVLMLKRVAESFVTGVPADTVAEIKAEGRVDICDLYYLSIWNKELLSEYMKAAFAKDMKKYRFTKLAHAPVNIYKQLLRSTFCTKEEWKRLYCEPLPEWIESGYIDNFGRMSIEDWMNLRELALKLFGEKADKVQFVSSNKLVDEGTLNAILKRFRHPPQIENNKVKKDGSAVLENAAGARLDGVVIRVKKGAVPSGKKARVIFGGSNIQLTNVIIELEEGETLYIPDNWTIKDSYIGKNNFEEGDEGGLIIGMTKYIKGVLEPVKGRDFKSGTCYSFICRIKDTPLFISANLNYPTTIMTDEGGYKYVKLQESIDAEKNQHALRVLRDIITQEFEKQGGIFPLRIYAASVGKDRQQEPISIDKAARDVAEKILKHAEGAKNEKYWVFIEAVRSAEKRAFTEKLEEALKSAHRNVVVLQEIWYRKSEYEIKRLKENDPEGWKKQDISWYRWDELREAVGDISSRKKGKVRLGKLYDPRTGKCNMKKSIDIMPDTIILYTGYYTSDIEKLCGRNTGAAPAILTGPSFRVYIGISPGESLKLRRERKRKHESDDDILSIDKEVYFPTFRRYVSTYDPAAWADVVFKLVSVEGETRLMEVTPHTKSWQEIDVEHYNPPAVKNVTIFGAGAMGRGLFGLLFRKWGHNVTFIDTDADIVARLDKDKMYKVMIKGAESTSPNNYYLVDKVEALLSSREEGNIRRIEKVIRDSDAICLSLPDTKLEETCQLLGKCLENRRLCGNENFLNIFLTTNKRNAAKDVKRMILSGVAEAYRATLEKYIDTYVGIIETTVLGGVRRGTEEEMRKSPTTVYIGGDNKLIADATAFKGECPEFMMQRKRNIEAEKTRRLALFSCQHATVGYLGYIAGHKDVYSAWANPWIRYEVTKLSRMLSRALVEKYGFFEIEQEEYIEWIEKIFSNRNFGDTIPGRITRDPLRRLGPDERFATSKYLLSSRRDTEEAEGSIALAIAACLCYDNKNDAQAVELQERLRRETIEVVLNNLCGIDPKSPLGKKVIKKYIQLRRFYAACSDFDTLAPKTFKEPTHVFIDFDNIIVNIKDIYRESFKKLYISIKKGGTNTIATEEAALESEAERCFDNIEDLNNMLPVFSDLIRLAVACGIPEESLKRAEEYLAEYGKEVKDKISGRIKDGKGDSLLKPSAQEFLIELQNHGKHVYFFTGLDLKFVTEHIIPHLNLQNYFRVIYKINGDNTVLGESLRLLMRSEGLERNRVVFLSSSPQTIGKVRSLTGDEITIVAVKENPQSEAAYPGANYLFGELKPTKSKLTLFTDGKLIPKAVSMPDERKTETQRTPENDIRWIIGQGRALESIDSAA